MLTDYTDYLTPYESADEFGISLTTVYNLLRAKKIPGFKIGKTGLTQHKPNQPCSYSFFV